MTEEDFEARRGWEVATLDGATFGDEWRNYEVQYIGWSLEWKPLPAAWYILNGYATGIKTPEPPDRPLLLCGVHVHYKRSRAFAEILFPNPGVGFESLDTIQNAQECNNPTELIGVWRGFELFKHIQKQRGRKPRKYTDPIQFEKDTIQAHLSLVRKNKDNYYEQVYEYSQEWIAAEMGFRSVLGWRKRANKLGVGLDGLKEKATAAERAAQADQPN
jgi:hypothetical protein